MEAIAAIFVVFLATIAIMPLIAARGMNRAVDRLIGAKHRALQSITETGRVPDSWREPFDRKIAALSGNPAQVRQIALVQQKAKDDYLRRLDELIRYTTTSSLVADRETRDLLLSKLGAVRAAWEQKEPENFSQEQMNGKKGY